MTIKFSKSLAKYYYGWLKDCEDSAIYCEQRGDSQRAWQYRDNAENYKKIIAENKEAIDFFSIGDNAHLLDSALPEKFRNYW